MNEQNERTQCLGTFPHPVALCLGCTQSPAAPWGRFLSCRPHLSRRHWGRCFGNGEMGVAGQVQGHRPLRSRNGRFFYGPLRRPLGRGLARRPMAGRPREIARWAAGAAGAAGTFVAVSVPGPWLPDPSEPAEPADASPNQHPSVRSWALRVLRRRLLGLLRRPFPAQARQGAARDCLDGEFVPESCSVALVSGLAKRVFVCNCNNMPDNNVSSTCWDSAASLRLAAVWFVSSWLVSSQNTRDPVEYRRLGPGRTRRPPPGSADRGEGP